MLVELGFWLCLGFVIYIYLGYFASIFVLATIVNRKVKKNDIEPRITVVIAAFNEERDIERTLMNKLSQDYPADRLEVIVVSDGSTDRTDEIVQSFVQRSEGRVKVLRQEPRQGKTMALNLALRHASSDIVVFADANSIYTRNTVRALVRNFADPSVGYVTGQMIYTNEAATGIGGGSGTYMSYENVLRALETKCGSIVGVDGGIDAIRRVLYSPMRSDQLPDFVLPLNVIEQGKRVVYESEAIVYEPALPNAADEFRMRVRVTLRALWALYDKRKLLNPFRYPLFAWQLIFHKVLRYAAFLPLVGLLFFNTMLVLQHPFYAGFLTLQLVAYGLAALGYFLRRLSAKASKLLVPYYFVLLNAACVIAFYKFLTGQKMIIWKPRQGE